MRATLLSSASLHSAADGSRWHPCPTSAPSSVTWTKIPKQLPNAAPNKRNPQPTSTVPPLPAKEEQELVREALGQSYRQQLQSVKDLLTPEAVEELRATLPPQDLASLERVLDDIKRIDQQKQLQSSVEPALPSRPMAQQLAAVDATYAAAEEHVRSMPADFRSYLLEHVFVGAGEEELDELINIMGKEQIQQLAQVYNDMLQFQYQPPELMAEKYVELSSRMEALAQQQAVPEASTSSAHAQQPSTPAPAPAGEAQPQAVLPTTALRPHLEPLQQQRRQRRRNTQAQARGRQGQVQPPPAPEAQQAPNEGSPAAAVLGPGAAGVSGSRGRRDVSAQDPDAWVVRPPEALQGILPAAPVTPLQLGKGTGSARRRATTSASSQQQPSPVAQTDSTSLQGSVQDQAQAGQQQQQQQQHRASLTQQQTPLHQGAQQQSVSSPSDHQEQGRHVPAGTAEQSGSRSSSSSPERRTRRAQASGRSSLLLPR